MVAETPNALPTATGVTVDDRMLPRRMMLRAIGALPDPEDPTGAGGAGGGAGGTNTNPPAGDQPPAGGEQPNTDPAVEREAADDATPVRRVTQRRLTTMLTREKDQGARQLVRDRFSVETLDELDALVKAGRDAARATMSDDQRRDAELADERRRRTELEAQLARRDDDNRVLTELQRADCQLPAAALAELRADGVDVGADPYTISAAVDRLKARAPQLFKPAAPATGQAATGAPAASTGNPGNPPGQTAPPATGFGSAGRAEAARRFGDRSKT